MKKNSLTNLKFILLAAIIALGVNYVSAWTGPTGIAPANDVAGLIDISTIGQAKNTAPISNSKLDFGGVLSAVNMAVWIDAVVTQDTYVHSLASPNYVCAEHTGKLVLCP